MGKFATILMAVIIVFPLTAWAEPQVGIKVDAQKEVKLQENGQTVIKRVAAESVEPGEAIFYTLTYTNTGDQKATNVIVNNPVPGGVEYLSQSAYGEGSTILFSIDKGQTFKQPQDLLVAYTLHDGKQMSRQAYASEYTNIRWVVGEVPAGGSGVLGFQVKVK